MLIVATLHLRFRTSRLGNPSNVSDDKKKLLIIRPTLVWCESAEHSALHVS